MWKETSADVLSPFPSFPPPSLSKPLSFSINGRIGWRFAHFFWDWEREQYSGWHSNHPRDFPRSRRLFATYRSPLKSLHESLRFGFHPPLSSQTGFILWDIQFALEGDMLSQGSLTGRIEGASLTGRFAIFSILQILIINISNSFNLYWAVWTIFRSIVPTLTWL